jgi:carbon storage regulator
LAGGFWLRCLLVWRQELLIKERIMLVLTRKIGERIIIGNDVVLTVLALPGNRVKLGISGPPEIPIHREELLQAIANEESSAKQSLLVTQPPLAMTSCGNS